MNLFLKMEGRLAVAKSAYYNLKQSQPFPSLKAGLLRGDLLESLAVKGSLSGQ
jgi:hypothetical protein